MKFEDHKKVREIGYELESIIVRLGRLRSKLINNSLNNPDCMDSDGTLKLMAAIRQGDLKYNELKKQRESLLHHYEITLHGNLITPGGIVQGHRATHLFYSSIDCSEMEDPLKYYWNHAEFAELFREIHARYSVNYENQGITLTAIKQLK